MKSNGSSSGFCLCFCSNFISQIVKYLQGISLQKSSEMMFLLCLMDGYVV